MGEAIVITSGKGGVGKTTTCANLGQAIASRGKRVALVDTDLGLRNLDIVLSLENRIKYDITHVVNMECEMRFALIKDKKYPNLVLLPASQTRDKDDVKPYQVQKVIEELCMDYDFVLVDCPAGIDRGFRNATAGVHRAIVVTTPEIPAVRDADRTIGVLEDMLIKPNIVINKVRPSMIRRKEMLDVPAIMDILQAELLGVVPDDEAIIASTNMAEPGVTHRPGAMSSKAYSNIACRVMGEQVPLMEIKPLTLFERLAKAITG